MLAARAAAADGREVCAAAFIGETEAGIEAVAVRVVWLKVGQLQRAIDFFHENQVTEAFMAGGVTKENMFINFEPDSRALAAIARLSELSDDAVLRLFAEELEKDGIAVRPSTWFAPELTAPEGVMTRRGPTPEEQADIEFGRRMAKALGELDIGQLVVVRNRTVTAVEAMEGSDEAIRRGGRLAREKAVVVKVCKPRQDRRFDLPSVGLQTIRVMNEVQASVLAVEAGGSLVFDRREMIRLADDLGICILGFREEA
ncbi:MAG: UDP-2,3-diacylglucosamine diphosphatase LpxI [Pseudomonadota bacterium]